MGGVVGRAGLGEHAYDDAEEGLSLAYGYLTRSAQYTRSEMKNRLILLSLG